MSLATLIALRGSLVTVTRPVETDAGGGSVIANSFTAVTTGMRMVIQPVTGKQAVELFGPNTEVVANGWTTDTATTVLTGDKVTVTSGFPPGGVFRVVDVLPFDMASPNAHRQLGLVGWD